MKIKKASNLSLLAGVWKNRLNLADYIQSIREENGEVFQFSFGAMNGFFFNEPELTKLVMVDRWANYPKSRRYKTLSPLIGESILVANGEAWRERRTLAQPIFQTRIIAGYRQTIEHEIKLILDKLHYGQVIDAYGVVSYFTFRVISKIMFSDDIDSIFHEFHQTVLKLQNECTQVALYPFAFMDKMPLPANIKFKKYSAIIHKMIDDIISKRLANPNKDQYQDLLSRYLTIIGQENKNFSMQELRNELITLLIAGNETTALTITWALHELSKSPAQEKLLQEMKELTLSNDAENSFLAMREVPYLNQVINETLRMYPAVWLYSREAAKDDELLGIQIKKDSLVIISPYFVHRNPKYWPDPLTWRPERFAEKYHEDAFIPFAKGPRHCIGMSLATFEMQLFLMQFFQRFSITPAAENKVKPKPLVNLYPSGPIKLKLHERPRKH